MANGEGGSDFFISFGTDADKLVERVDKHLSQVEARIKRFQDYLKQADLTPPRPTTAPREPSTTTTTATTPRREEAARPTQQAQVPDLAGIVTTQMQEIGRAFLTTLGQMRQAIERGPGGSYAAGTREEAAAPRVQQQAAAVETSFASLASAADVAAAALQRLATGVPAGGAASTGGAPAGISAEQILEARRLTESIDLFDSQLRDMGTSFEDLEPGELRTRMGEARQALSDFNESISSTGRTARDLAAIEVEGVQAAQAKAQTDRALADQNVKTRDQVRAEQAKERAAQKQLQSATEDEAAAREARAQQIRSLLEPAAQARRIEAGTPEAEALATMRELGQRGGRYREASRGLVDLLGAEPGFAASSDIAGGHPRQFGAEGTAAASLPQILNQTLRDLNNQQMEAFRRLAASYEQGRGGFRARDPESGEFISKQEFRSKTVDMLADATGRTRDELLQLAQVLHNVSQIRPGQATTSSAIRLPEGVRPGWPEYAGMDPQQVQSAASTLAAQRQQVEFQDLVAAMGFREMDVAPQEILEQATMQRGGGAAQSILEYIDLIDREELARLESKDALSAEEAELRENIQFRRAAIEAIRQENAARREIPGGYGSKSRADRQIFGQFGSVEEALRGVSGTKIRGDELRSFLSTFSEGLLPKLEPEAYRADPRQQTPEFRQQVTEFNRLRQQAIEELSGLARTEDVGEREQISAQFEERVAQLKERKAELESRQIASDQELLSTKTAELATAERAGLSQRTISDLRSEIAAIESRMLAIRRRQLAQASQYEFGGRVPVTEVGGELRPHAGRVAGQFQRGLEQPGGQVQRAFEEFETAARALEHATEFERQAGRKPIGEGREALLADAATQRRAASAAQLKGETYLGDLGEGFRGQFAILDRFMQVISSPRFAQMPENLRQNVAEHLAQTVERAGTRQAREAAAVVRQAPEGAWAADPGDPTAQVIEQRRQQLARSALQETMQRYEGVRFSQQQLEGVDVVRRVGGQGPRAGQIALTSEAAQIVKSAVGEAFPRVQQELFGRLIDEGRVPTAELAETQPAQLRQAQEDVQARLAQAEQRAAEGAPAETKLISVLNNLNAAINKLAACCERFGSLQKDIQGQPGGPRGDVVRRDPNQMRLFAEEAMEELAEGAPVQRAPQHPPGLTQREIEQQTFAMERAMQLASLRGERGGYAMSPAAVGRVAGAEAREEFGEDLTPEQLKAVRERVQLTRDQAVADEALAAADQKAASGTQVLTDAQFRANEAMSILSTSTRQQIAALQELRSQPQALQQTPEFQQRLKRQEATTFAAVEEELQGAAAGTRVHGDVVADMLDIPPARRNEVVQNARVTVSAQTQAVKSEMNTLRRAALEVFGTNGFISRMVNSTGTFIVRQFSALLVFGTINALQKLGKQALEAEQTFVRVSDALAATGRAAGGVENALQDIAIQTNVALNDTYSVMSNLVGVFESTDEALDATRLVNQLELISQGALSAREGYRSLSAVTGAFYEQFQERGLTDEEAITHIADVAVRIQDLTSVNIEDTIEGLGALGETAKQMGIDAELMAASVALAAKAVGQTGTAAAENLGRVFSRFQDVQVQDLLVDMGITSQAVVDARNFQQVLLDLFSAFPDLSPSEQGVIGRALGQEREFKTTMGLLSQGTKALEVFGKAQNATGAAAERAEEVLSKLQGRIGQLGKRIQVFVQNLLNLGLFEWVKILVGGFEILIKPINMVLQAINRLGEMSAIANMATNVGILILQFRLLRRMIRGTAAEGVMSAIAAPFTGATRGAGLPGGAFAARYAPPTRQVGAAAAAGGGRTIYSQPVAPHAFASTGGHLPAMYMAHGAPAPVRPYQTTRTFRGANVNLMQPRGGPAPTGFRARAAATYQSALGKVNAGFAKAAPRIGQLAQGLGRMLPHMLGVAFAMDMFSRNARDLRQRLIDLVDAAPTKEPPPETEQEAYASALGEARTEATQFRGGSGFRQYWTDKARYQFSSVGRFLDPMLPGRQGGVGANQAVLGELEEPFLEDTLEIRQKLVKLAQEEPTEEVFAEVAKLSEELGSQELLDKAGNTTAQIANAAVEIEQLKGLATNVNDKLVRVQAGMTSVLNLSLTHINSWMQAFTFMNGLSSRAISDNREALRLLIETSQIPEALHGELMQAFSQGGLAGSRSQLRALEKVKREAESEVKEAQKDQNPERLAGAQQALQQAVQAHAQLQEAILQQMVEMPEVTAELAAHEGRFGRAASQMRTAAREMERQAAEMPEGVEKMRMTLQAREAMFQALEMTLREDAMEIELTIAQTDDPTEAARLELENVTTRLEAFQAADEGTVSAEQMNEARIAVEGAQRALRDTLEADADAIIQTSIIRERDPTARARLELELATAQLARAEGRGTQAYEQAQQALIQAQQALADSVHQDAQAIMQTRAARARDPLAGARIELQMAQRELQHAQQTGAGTQAVQSAIQGIIQAERAIEDEMESIISSRTQLAVAIAQVAGLDIEVADLQLQEARRTLAAATQRGAGEAELNQLRAEAINAEGALRDVRYQEQLDFIDFQLQMEQITANAAISMLQEMLTWADLTEDQRRQLQLKIKGLQDDLRNQLAGGFNIPGEIDLPTAYEVRRSLGLNSAGGTNNIMTRIINASIDNTFTFTVTSDAQAKEIANQVSTSIEQQLSKQVNSYQPTPHLVGI